MALTPNPAKVLRKRATHGVTLFMVGIGLILLLEQGSWLANAMSWIREKVTTSPLAPGKVSAAIKGASQNYGNAGSLPVNQPGGATSTQIAANNPGTPWNPGMSTSA